MGRAFLPPPVPLKGPSPWMTAPFVVQHFARLLPLDKQEATACLNAALATYSSGNLSGGWRRPGTKIFMLAASEIFHHSNRATNIFWPIRTRQKPDACLTLVAVSGILWRRHARSAWM